LIDSIISNWQKQQFQKLYWFEGDEPYYIDKLVAYAEQHILTTEQKEFNLTVFYGKDAEWASIVNACRRYPMFSDIQLVIVKEANHMKDIEKLESYFLQPLPSTILIVANKDGKVDKRKSFGKMVAKLGGYQEFKKIYDNKLPEWANAMIVNKGYTITNKALMLVVEFIGNDLNRLENEIEKLIINLATRKIITEDDVEKYIGISKEYNVFELQAAFKDKNFAKAIQIIQYFGNNPKSAPLALIIPTLYSFFSKVYMLAGLSNRDDKTVASTLGIAPFLVRDYNAALKTYGQTGIEKIILLLNNYNLKSLGMHKGNATDAELLKELAFKITHN
jgi:DNA polymerase III subunit delta